MQDSSAGASEGGKLQPCSLNRLKFHSKFHFKFQTFKEFKELDQTTAAGPFSEKDTSIGYVYVSTTLSIETVLPYYRHGNPII